MEETTSRNPSLSTAQSGIKPEAAPSASRGKPEAGTCRFCATPLQHRVLDLGMSPLCESYVPADRASAMEPFYPLRVWVCSRCFLVQLEAYVSEQEIFSEYAYFSSFSDSWVEHCRRFVERVVADLNLTSKSRVVEVASNDGYLLKFLVKRGIPVLGVEPAANVAAAAAEKGIPTLVRFFGRVAATELAASGHQADLLIGNNVLAQVPDLNDFVGGLKILLAPTGVISLEFPHLHQTILGNQFDQVYHEHFSYFSLFSVERILGAHGLQVFDVEELPTHGGSLRVWARHAESATSAPTGRLESLRNLELTAGVNTLAYYRGFEQRARATKRKLLRFLIEAAEAGQRVVGYGAPGKGNTLLNYCGIRTDLLEFTVDRNPYKQGKLLPGTHIPIFPPERIGETRPDFVLILPWNLRIEIMAQLDGIRDWGGRFVVPIPEVMVYP